VIRGERIWHGSTSVRPLDHINTDSTGIGLLIGRRLAFVEISVRTVAGRPKAEDRCPELANAKLSLN
jgi:hypothetical protein